MRVLPIHRSVARSSGRAINNGNTLVANKRARSVRFKVLYSFLSTGGAEITVSRMDKLFWIVFGAINQAG